MKLTANKKLLANSCQLVVNNRGFTPIKSGFTIVEILVAITILSTLIAGALFTINPQAQINKAQDAARTSDLQQVKSALEIYYHDNNCYPTQSKGIPFGKTWESADGAIYMKKVPQDPKCTGTTGTNCYRYRTDGSSCPQWNVTFAQLTKNSSITNACPLSSLSNCTPSDFSGGTWACAMSGAVDCNGLALATLAGGVETTQPTATPTLGPTAIPTPIPDPPAGSVTYNNLSNIALNPYVTSATIMPFTPLIGKTQSISVDIVDSVGDVTSVKVIMVTDNKVREFTLQRVAGTFPNTTTWGGQRFPWDVDDTYCTRYAYDIIVTDDKGNTQTGYIRANYLCPK